MIGWEATRAAIARLQGLLKCLKCGQSLKDPCSLEGCDHSFCRSCIQEEVGSDSKCPKCGAPCWIKDLKTNRQLSRTIFLCNKLSDIINPGTDTNHDPKDDKQEHLEVMEKDDTATIESGFVSSTELSVQDVSENGKRCPNVDDSQNINETVLRRREYDRNADVFGSQTVSNTPMKRVKTPTKTYGNKSSRNRAKKLCSPVDFILNDSGILENSADNHCSSGGRKEFEGVEINLVEDDGCDLGDKQCEVEINLVEDDGCDLGDKQCEDDITGDEDRMQVDMNTSDGSEVLVFDMETISTPSPPKARKSRNTPRSGTAETLKGKRVRGKSSNVTPGKPAWMKRNARGETPLHIASIKGDLASVKDLLSQGADPNLKDNAGWTPLHEACNHGYTQIVSLLLDHGAVIDVPGFELETPLHDAVSNGRVEVVKLLVARGASTTAKNQRGLTAQDYARWDIMKEALTPATLGNELPTTPSGPCNETAVKVNTTASLTPKVLLATGLGANEKEQFNKCAEILGATILTEYHNNVSHVVCSVNKKGHCLRTMKYLLGILTGKWIVKFSWISKCMREKRWVPEEEYEVEGTSQTHVFASRRSRQNTQAQLPPLFDGCHFFLYGSFVSPTPSRDDIQELLRAGGGSILTREPKSDNEAFREPAPQTRPYHLKQGTPLGDCSKYIVYDPLAERKPKLVRTPSVCTVPVSWIMSCISHFELCDFPAEGSAS